jgi:PAS domain S-box-containing protein
VLGYDAGEFVGQPVDRIFAPEDVAAGIPRQELEVARTRGRASDDRWMVKKGGVRFWASGVTTSLWDGGRLLGFGKVLRDLSEQKALQQRVEAGEIAVRQNEERLRLALSAARVGTWRVDLRARTSTVDANLARLLELGAHDMTVALELFFDRIHPDDRERVREVFDRAARTAEPIRTEFRVACRDGGTRWLRDHGEVIVGANGDPAYLTGAVADITEQRETDERLRDIQRMEAVGKLAGGVAHEVNNMMGVVLGFTEFLLDDYLPGDRRRRDLEQVREAAGRAATVTAQLLAFSRRQILQPTLVKLSGIVEALRPVLARMLGEDKSLVVRAGPDVAYVKADRGQLEQVVINLSLNARDAMGPGGRLVIETQNVTVDTPNGPEGGVPSGNYVMLSLSDTGHGMEPATLERIFEPFFTTKPTGQGTGLGLSVVHGIVHQSDGFIRTETVLGQGTTFRVYLPVASPLTQQPRRTTGPAIIPGRGETVLVVEDEPMVRGRPRGARRALRRGHARRSGADGHRHAPHERLGPCHRGYRPMAPPAGTVHVGLRRRRDDPPRPADAGGAVHSEAVRLWRTRRQAASDAAAGVMRGSGRGPLDGPAVTAGRGRQVGAVHDDPGTFQRDEPAADHLVELGENLSNALLGIHALEDDR